MPDPPQRDESLMHAGASASPLNEPRRGRLRDPGSRASLLWARAAVALLLALTVALQSGLLAPSAAPPGPEADSGPAPPAALLVLQARYVVGSSGLLQAVPADSADAGALESQRASLVETLEAFASSAPADQLRLAMAAGELLGGAAALHRIDTLLQSLPPDQTPAWLLKDADALRDIYSGGGADSLTAAQREELVGRHGWFGRLALTFGAPARDGDRQRVRAQATRTALAVTTLAFLAGSGLLAGVAILGLALFRWSRGRLRGAYAPPAAGGSVYLETFALFLLAFLGLSVVGEFVSGAVGWDATPVVMWLILPVALWPLLRGAPAGAWRFAIGWHRGRGALREIGAGALGYLAGLPVLAVGIGLTFLLIQAWAFVAGAGEGGGAPTHPIIAEAQSADFWTIASIYLLGVVWAPIVEETFFRGCLFHHLRGGLSALWAALLVGLTFAIVHPQGPLAIPAIAALGFTFAMIRQWRGSIIASATAHAINNAVVLSVLVVALG